MIIGEVKEQIINHGDPELYFEKRKNKTAVDGIKHYLYKIIEKALITLQFKLKELAFKYKNQIIKYQHFQ
ncbi:hypothetical protein [Spiroplasma endosymbiont of Villa modesta]|uniref:hypothetical protein n=1 Tax=Spiroplasma endosymbiont of Villa modesta TaxID=3066293 RepID=UPI00313D947C